jgi:outer membrane protein insertion porin family
MATERVKSHTRMGICVIAALVLMSLLPVYPALAVDQVGIDDSAVVGADSTEVVDANAADADAGDVAATQSTPDTAGGLAASAGAAGAVAEVAYGSLSAISIMGNTTVPTDQIRAVLSVTPGTSLTDRVIEQGANEIFNMGYFSSVVPTISEFLGGLRLTYRVEELPAYRGAIFEGNTVFPSSRLEELIGLEKGKAINRNALDRGFQAIVDYYGNAGYIIGLSLADPAVDENGRLHVVVEEGRIGTIKVAGFEKTRESVIWNEIKSKPGDLFSVTKLQEDARRIYNLRIFADVAIIPEARPDSVDVDVTFEVVEQKTAYFNGAISWSSEEGIGGEVALVDDNFLGRAHSASISLELTAKGRYYELAYTAPRVGQTDLSLSTSVYDTYKERKSGDVDYTEYRKGGTLGLGKPLDLYTSIFGNMTIEDTRNVWSGSTPPPDVTAGGKTHKVSLSIVRDTRDDFFNPTTGGEVSASVQYAGGVLGGDYNFVKYQLSLSRLFAVAEGHVAGVRLMVGTSTGDLPSQELFRVGGTDTIRGIRDNSLAGDKMAVANVEYRFDLAKSLQGVVFVDAGNAFAKGTSFGLDGMKVGYGVGVRFTLVPGFTLRLDYGFSEGGGRLHFSMGNLF